PRGPEIGSAVLVESRVLETVEGIGEHLLRYPRGTTQPVQGRADVVPAPRTGSHAVDLLVHVPGARTEGGVVAAHRVHADDRQRALETGVQRRPCAQPRVPVHDAGD